MDWLEIATVVNVGLLALVGIYTVRANRRKTSSEADLNSVRAAKEIMEELRFDVKALRARIGALETDLNYERKRNYALEEWAKALSTQIIEEFSGSPTPYAPIKTKYIP